MKQGYLSRIGGIIFFIGLILILLSWNETYPVYMPESNELIITQFPLFFWTGIILSFLGLFLAGYYSKTIHVKVISVILFLIILYSYVFYFVYIPTSDSGGLKSMFEVFHQVGINSAFEPYYYYPVYFTLNEMTSQTLSLNVNDIATLFFVIFGILIAFYIFLFLIKITKDNSYQIAFLASIIYFTSIFTFLNYQWAPQTLAFIFFLLLLILFYQNRFEYKFLGIFIFIILVFTHLFIPIIFLLFFGFYGVKKKELRSSFLFMSLIYISVIIYYASFYLVIIIEAFKQSIYGFGQQYTFDISMSLKEPEGFVSQIISLVNRVRIPLAWIVVSTGFTIEFIKKRLSYTAMALGITGGVYFAIGLFYPILGMRALQVLFIPLTVGIIFFVSKWKKPTYIFIIIILILSVFGSIRNTYDTYLYQQTEEENACDFLVQTYYKEQPTQLVIGGVNFGYFSRKFHYENIQNYSDIFINMIVPINPEFYYVFNNSIEKNTYVLYNPNLGREMISFGLNPEEVYKRQQVLNKYNKIYASGKSFITIGR